MKSFTQFVENEEFYGLNHTSSDVSKLNGLRSDVERILQLVIKNYQGMDELLDCYLKVGGELLGFNTGAVSRIDNDKTYHIVSAHNPTDIIQKDAIYLVKNTPCSDVYETGEVVGICKHGSDEQSRQLCENFEIETHFSAPIFVDDDLYGTFSFSSYEKRKKGFSKHEVELISMMAKTLGKLIQGVLHEASLKSLNDRLYKLVGYVAHDLRNPLGVIGNLAQIITSQAVDERAKNGLVNRIQASSQRCLEFVNTVLGVAALSAGKIKIQPKPFFLKTVIDESLRDYEPLLKGKNLIVKIDIRDAEIYGDEPRIFQVVNNLLSNALKYSAASSDVVIKADAVIEGMLLIEVANQIGDALRDDEDVSSQDLIHSSTGFGLDIAREIVELHGSHLVVEETAGSYIARFSLPVVG